MTDLETQPSPAQLLPLAESLDLCAAGDLTRALLAQRGHDLALDASQVRRVGGQCLQVLLAAQAAWAADGRVLTVSAPSTEFIEGVALLGAPSLAVEAAI